MRKKTKNINIMKKQIIIGIMAGVISGFFASGGGMILVPAFVYLLNMGEQKARATYEKLIDLSRDEPDVVDPLRFLRQREIVHFQRFGEALRGVQDKMAEKKFYMNDGTVANMANKAAKECNQDNNCN